MKAVCDGLTFEQHRITTQLDARGHYEIALDGPARLRMGAHRVELEAGDLLLVEARRLHDVEDFPGFNTRVVVVSFQLR